MIFEEDEPTFTLTMTIHEAINLWKITNSSHNNGNAEAKIFVEALYDFASNSNSYDHLLNSKKKKCPNCENVDMLIMYGAGENSEKVFGHCCDKCGHIEQA